MSADEGQDPAAKQRAALRRSMAVTRMLDYGMDHWDATALHGSAPARAWHEVAVELADAQGARAEAAASRGDVETAVACHRRAAAALVFAQMEFNADVPLKVDLYGRLTASYEKAAELDTDLAVERLSVPSGGGSCSAWLVRPSPDHAGPTVVVVGGQSGWGPAYHRQAEALARRGLTTVLLEAPGQGETRILGGLHLDTRVDTVFSAALDAVQERTGWQGSFGVWGNSFGGLLAARAAVHDDRFAACCVNGAAADPRPLPFRAAREQSQALLGVDSDEAAGAVLRTLWLDPDIDSMDASLLVLHGGADPLVTLEQQQVFLSMSARATLRVWEDGEHTIYNHSAERTEFVSDWFRSQLSGD